VAVSDPSSVSPIWELVQGIDKAKGDALQKALTEKWAQEGRDLPQPDRYFEPPTYTITIVDDHNVAGPDSKSNTFSVPDAYKNKTSVAKDDDSFGMNWTTTATVLYKTDPSDAVLTCTNTRWACNDTPIDLTVSGTTTACMENDGRMHTHVGVYTSCSVTVSLPSMEGVEAAAGFDEGEPTAAAAASLRGAILSVS
jgi:hypothetical protein